MNKLSEEENREIPFSKRFTLSEIWTYLDKKYPDDTSTTSNESEQNSV